jgi:hypothetical protein
MITSIKKTQDPALLHIEYTLSDAAGKDNQWPDFETVKEHLSNLLDGHKKNGKELFNIIFIDSEPTEWSGFLPLCQHLKENYKCILEISTTGTNGLIWWTKAARVIDQVNLTARYGSLQKFKMRNLADYLYELNLLVSINVFMDPNNFEECEEIVEFFKDSRRDFPIYVKPILHNGNTKYNEKQTSYLDDHLKQIPNGEWLEYVSIGKWKIIFNSPNN